jgi:hypothetical protein
MDNRLPRRAETLWPVVTVLLSSVCGCAQSSTRIADVSVPAPLDYLLPESVHLGPWLQMDPTIPGIEVTVQARDRLGDFTKAFGTFRFEVCAYRDNAFDRRGKLLAVWDAPLTDPQTNRLHWEDIHRAYKFRLRWNGRPSGRYVMVVYFDSPFTSRLVDQQTLAPEGMR